VADQFKNVDFSRYSLHVSYVDNLLLDQDLDGHFFACQGMGGQLDFTESALSNGFA
jgi:hypothetical protein